MTDYNDGEWHHYSGQILDAVHAESLVTFVWHDEGTGRCGVEYNTPARKVVWRHVLKFRVTKPHREPRVIWVNVHSNGDCYAYSTKERASRLAVSSDNLIAVRFVEAPE